MVEAIDLYRQREELSAEDRRRALLAARGDEVRYDPRTPVLGNPAGDVTVVEFFDYKSPSAANSIRSWRHCWPGIPTSTLC